jgi:hypothetical protein
VSGDYEIHVVDQAGTRFVTLANVLNPSPLRNVLNHAGSFRFALHVEDAQATQVLAIEREVQVWRDGALLAGDGWLAVVTPEATIDAGTALVEFECRGLLWYFDRRFIGDADRTNYLGAGQGTFDANLTGWTATGTTATFDGTKRASGTGSAKLVTAAAGADAFLSRTVSVTGTGVGTLLTVAGWFFVDPTGYLGEAYGGRGLFLQRSVAGVVQDFDFATLANDDDGNVPTGSWQRREVTVHVPPSTTEDITVRLYGPGGTIWWDEVILVAMDAVSYYETDQATIAGGIALHLQDAFYGKSTLSIPTSTPATGVVRDAHYQHAEHMPGGRSMADFTTLDDGFDHSVETTATATSGTRTYTTHYPRKGVLRSALSTDEIVRLRWVPVDGDQAANSVVVLGDGDGPDREEGSAIDTTAFGGVTLEKVISAPPGTLIDRLDEKAAEELRVSVNAARLEVTLGPGLRIGTLLPGDTISVPAVLGYVDTTGTWRITETELDTVADSLSFKAEVA